MVDVMSWLEGASAIAGAGVDADSSFEPQRVNNFMVRLTPPDASPDLSKVIEMSIRSFPFPKSETSVEVLNLLNVQRKVPGRTTFGDLDLVAVDYVDAETVTLLRKWRTLVFNTENGTTGRVINIKGSGDLILFPPDGSKTRIWHLSGVWPSKDDLGAGDMEATGPNVVTITFTVDYWREALA